MKRYLRNKNISLVLCISALVVTAVAWQNKPNAGIKNNFRDTIPERNKKIRNIDDALEQLEKSKVEVDRSLNSVDWEKINTDIEHSIKNIRINESEIKAQVAEAMKQVDAAKVQAQVQNAISNIDAKKIQENVQQSLKSIDAEKIKAEVAETLKSIDLEKIKADINASIAKIDWDKMKMEMEEAKNTDMIKVENELKNIRPEIEKSIKEAHININNARKELTSYKELIEGLDKDGLINKKEAYKIEYQKEQLYINGHKQSQEIVNKYNHILKGLKDFTITSDTNDFNIQSH